MKTYSKKTKKKNIETVNQLHNNDTYICKNISFKNHFIIHCQLLLILLVMDSLLFNTYNISVTDVTWRGSKEEIVTQILNRGGG